MSKISFINSLVLSFFPRKINKNHGLCKGYFSASLLSKKDVFKSCNIKVTFPLRPNFPLLNRHCCIYNEFKRHTQDVNFWISDAPPLYIEYPSGANLCRPTLDCTSKKLSLCPKFSFCKTYIFATLWCKSLIFQIYIIWSNSIHSLKY